MINWLWVVYRMATIPYSPTAFSDSVARDLKRLWVAARCWYVARTDSGIIRSPPARVKLCMKTSSYMSRCELWWTEQYFRCSYSASCAPEITCMVPPMHHDLRVLGLPQGNKTVRTGNTLRFYCYNDKPMDGPTESQCLESGQWSSPFPTCAGVFTSNRRENTPLRQCGFSYLESDLTLCLLPNRVLPRLSTSEQRHCQWKPEFSAYRKTRKKVNVWLFKVWTVSARCKTSWMFGIWTVESTLPNMFR